MGIEGWKRLSAEERRSQLLELGHELFNSSRYSDISVDDIAQAAGISKGLLYHYFPSKEQFFLAGVERGCEQLLAATDPDEALPPIERLVSAVRGYLDYVEQNSFGYLNLFRGETSMLPGIQRVCEETRRTIAQRFVGKMSVAGRELHATLAAFRGYQGFVEALVLNWLEERKLSRKQVEALTVTALMSAVYSGLQIDLGVDAPELRALSGAFAEAREHLRHEFGVRL